MMRTKQVARMAFRQPPPQMFAGGAGAQFQPVLNAIAISMNVEDPMNEFREYITPPRNPEDIDQPEMLQRALLFFNRYQRHISQAEQHEMLLMLGTSLLAQNEPTVSQFFQRLNTLNLSDEDLSVLLHESGVSRSFLEHVVSDRSDQNSLEKLIMVSKCMPLLSHEDHWDAFMMLVDSFLASVRSFGEEKSSADVDEFAKLSNLITSEFLRCAMTEVRSQIFDRMIASVRECLAEAEPSSRTKILDCVPTHLLFDIFGIVETSSDFLDRITKLVTISLKNQTLGIMQHAAQYLSRFLTNHPEHVDYFLESSLFTNSSLYPTLLAFSPDLLCLIASSSSALATAFLSPNTLPRKIASLFSTRFPTPLRTFCTHLAATRPTILASLIEGQQPPIVGRLIRSIIDTVHVVPSSVNNPRCLSFGTDTADWIAFLGVLGTITRHPKKQVQNADTPSVQASLLGLLILLSASTDIVLSDAAVSEIACGCGLSEGEMKAILFETPLSFPIPPDWVLETHVPFAVKVPCLCASVGPTLLKFNDVVDESETDRIETTLTVFLVRDTLKCLVNVLNTVNPTFIPHPSFSPSLTQTPTMPSFWKAQPIATTLPALKAFVAQLITLASSTLVRQSHIGVTLAQDGGLITSLHLLPHLDGASKTSALTLMLNQQRGYGWGGQQHMPDFAQVVLELALSESYRSSTTLLQITRQIVSSSLPTRHSSPFGGGSFPVQNELEASISNQLDMAVGEERWMLFTELLCTSTTLSTDQIETMLLEAENDDQSRVVLSSLALGTVQLKNQGVSFSDEGHTRLLRCAGQTNNMELASHAWAWIERGSQLPTRQAMHGMVLGQVEVNEKMTNLLVKVLGDLNDEGREEREGDEEGAAERKKERKSVLHSCLQVLSRQIIWTNVDSTQFVPLLIPLTLNADTQIMCTLIDVFAGIAKRTRNSASPISLSTVDVTVASQPSPVTQSLLSFVSSFLLKSVLLYSQSSPYSSNPFATLTQTQTMREPVDVPIRRMWLNLEGDKSGTGEALMKRAIEIGCELLESTIQASEAQPSPLHHVASLNKQHLRPNYSPNQIWGALCTLFFSSPNPFFTPNTFPRLSDFFNRLVETMLKATSDCVMNGAEESMTLQSTFSTILSTLTNPLVAVKQNDWATHPALTNLLHSTATLLIRHDSSLPELSLFMESMQQGMQRGDGRKKKTSHTSHPQHSSRVDVIIRTFTEEGVEDRMDMRADINQRYPMLLGANASQMATGVGMFGNPGMAYPFGHPQMGILPDTTS
ncbi:hypothetical protein BLNAU_20548 [Blattamonas nauphoetae]|uniref:Uncharacterized protein n=1 Tax=Blattamonas nauphoetae TaxID=2049346 RepID=A0ABQ9WYK3_9EUKA|nr:hypothetical protein BLNAU_20548 [Blattamonas nauphoetae]